MYITYIIIAITVAVSLYALKEKSVLQALIMNPYVTDQKNEYYRFITSGFIHLDHMHLLFNMISFYFFGIAVETVFEAHFGDMAKLYFIMLYLLGIIVSDIPSFFKNKHNIRYNSLGASGGVAAVVFAFILFTPLDDISLYFAIPIPGFIFGALYIIFSWHQGRKSGDNINHDAHLYGALFGLVYCIVIYPPSIVNFFYQIRNWTVFN
jgi:membrane associated rhomboid family serine protease